MAQRSAQRLMTPFRRVTGDAIWSLLGQVAPMAAAFFSIPPLMHRLGEERFGVLALAWMVIGYFSFLDLGLGRALTQVVASRLGEDREDEISEFIGSALLALLALGTVGGILLALLASWMVAHVLKVPPALQAEAVGAFQLMGASIPLVTLTSGLRGLLEARRWFAQLNLIRIPLGLFNFIGPWLTVTFSPRLVPVVAVLLCGRLAGALAHTWLARQAFPHVPVTLGVRAPILRKLLGLGGWMTVTNIVGPLMVNLDRFVIGSTLSLEAVAFYATPYEMVTKLLIVGAALSGALFPAVSACRNSEDRHAVRQLYRRTALLLVATLGPVMVIVVIGAPWGLSHWISPDFASHSTAVLQILAIGVLVNAFASIPFTVVQGMGRPKLTAILHLLELPLYLGMLWGLIRLDGIRGAACAWSIRVAFDAAALVLISRRLLNASRG